MDQPEISEEDSITLFVDLIAETIDKNNMEELRLFLQVSPLNTTDQQSNEQFLKYFLEMCEFRGSMEACNIVIEAWENSNPSEHQMPIRTSIFTIQGINPLTAAFTARADQKNGFISHMMRLVYYPSIPSTARACDLLTRVYGEQVPSVYQGILDEIEESRNEDGEANDTVREYVTELLKLVNEYAPVPRWIISPGEILPSNDELMDSLPKPPESVVIDDVSVDEAIDITTSFFASLPGVTIQDPFDVRETLRERYSKIGDKNKRIDLINTIRLKDEYNLHNDPDIMRVLGPSNPETGDVDLDSNSNAPCARFGGCRMLLCVHFENVGDDGEVRDEELEITGDYDMLEWFTGSCDVCNRRIRSKHHAVRMPMTSGGWDGCYCSWEHVKQDIIDPYSLIHKLLKKFMNDVKSNGIYDRYWLESEEERIEFSYENFLLEAEAFVSREYPQKALYSDIQFENINTLQLPPPEDISMDNKDYSSSRETEMTLIRENMEMGIKG